MTQHAVSPSFYTAFYTTLQHALLEANMDYTPAQLHGLFCGMISVNINTTRNVAIKSIKQLLKTDSKKSKYTLCKKLLLELYETTYRELNNFSFEFTLLLPDDNVDIAERTEAIGLWCQGFLTGLGNQAKEGCSPEGSEALQDLMDIAQVSYDETTEDEESETAYFEVVEYVRLAVILIFQEYRTPSVGSILTDVGEQ